MNGKVISQIVFEAENQGKINGNGTIVWKGSSNFGCYKLMSTIQIFKK